MKKKLASSLNRAKLSRIYLMDWNILDSNDWTKVNWTLTNWTFIKATKWYVAQQLSWGATTSLTYTSITYTDSYIRINWVFTKNSAKVTSTALNWTNWETYFWLYFTNATLTESEEQSLRQWGERQLAWWSDNILSSAVAMYDMAWDASDIIGWNNGTVSWATLTTDRFWVANRAYSFDGNDYITTWNTSNLWTAISFHIEMNISATVQDYANIISKRISWTNIEFQIMIAEASWYAGNRYKFFVQYYNWWVLQAFSNILYTNYLWQNISLDVTISWWVIRFYINWVNDWTTYSWSSIVGSTWNMLIWVEPWPAANTYFTWRIDRLIIFNKALSADEVKQLYEQSSTKYLYPFRKTFPLNLNDWLVWAWLGDYSGNTYYDVSWQWNNGTGTAIANTRVGQHKVMGFNGSSSWIQVADSDALTLWSGFTINIWVSPTSLPTSWGVVSILSKYDNEPNAWWYDIQLYNNWWTQQLNVLFKTNQQANPTISVNHTLTTWTRQMITATLDWAKLKLYKNMVLLWELSTTAFPANNTKLLNIWRFWYYAPSSSDLWRWFNWQIQWVRIWNKALTQSQIIQLYYATYIQ